MQKLRIILSGIADNAFLFAAMFGFVFGLWHIGAMFSILAVHDRLTEIRNMLRYGKTLTYADLISGERT